MSSLFHFGASSEPDAPLAKSFGDVYDFHFDNRKAVQAEVDDFVRTFERRLEKGSEQLRLSNGRVAEGQTALENAVGMSQENLQALLGALVAQTASIKGICDQEAPLQKRRDEARAANLLEEQQQAQLYAKKLQAEIEQIEQAYARDVDTLHKTYELRGDNAAAETSAP